MTYRPTDFFDLTRSDLESWFADRQEPPYRARQVFINVYQRGVREFGAMTDLPRSLRAELAESWTLTPVTEVRKQTSEEDGSDKFLWRLADGRNIESVLMQADYGWTGCFSTQVGCAFGCSFCITAKMGRIRNLTAGEIVGQIVELDRRRAARAATNAGLNLVAMGMGEPFDNADALFRALAILRDPLGFKLGPKRITISTVGVVPGIERLTREDPEVGLAVSLNATTDAVRRTLMPVTRKYPIAELLDAVERYTRASSRWVTLEYVLIRGLNDTPADADRLGTIGERFPSKVNVIPFNPSPLFPYERPSRDEVDAFAKRLWPRRTTVTVRYSKGLDILAACGQLGYDQVKDKIALGD